MILIDPMMGSLPFPVLAGAAFIGEGPFSVWLLLKGVDVPKWTEHQQAS